MKGQIECFVFCEMMKQMLKKDHEYLLTLPFGGGDRILSVIQGGRPQFLYDRCYKFAVKTHMLACGMKAASLRFDNSIEKK